MLRSGTASPRSCRPEPPEPGRRGRVDDAVLTPTRLAAARIAKRRGLPIRYGSSASGPYRKAATAKATASGRSRSIAGLARGERTNLVPGLAHARRSASAARTSSSCSPLVAGRLRREGAPASRRSSPRRCERERPSRSPVRGSPGSEPSGVRLIAIRPLVVLRRAIDPASQLLRCAGILEIIHCTKSDTLRVWNHTRPGPVKSVTSPSPPRIDDFHPPALRTPYRTDSSNATT
jgi:hypothetical protein